MQIDYGTYLGEPEPFDAEKMERELDNGAKSVEVFTATDEEIEKRKAIALKENRKRKANLLRAKKIKNRKHNRIARKQARVA